MTKKASKKVKRKRGPKEERLVITDPKAALDRLLKKPTPPKLAPEPRQS